MQYVAQAEIPALEWPHSLAYRVMKRGFDLLLASTLILLLAPVLLICAVLILYNSPGPALFRQKRVGAQGREFTCFKFRSMCTDADPAIHQQYAESFIRGVAETQSHAGNALFKIVSDPRVTSVGRWLRRTSLDELPQLFNVVRGEMSLVGPRPPIRYELEHYRPEQLRRLAVKPGMTGLWQVSGRSQTTFDEMVALDLAYIEVASFLTDLRILLRTIPVVLLRRDAH